MPKRAKKAWRRNIDLEDLYEGIERTRQELESGYPFVLATMLIDQGRRARKVGFTAFYD